jgi:UDP-glucose 4-epimerase
VDGITFDHVSEQVGAAPRRSVSGPTRGHRAVVAVLGGTGLLGAAITRRLLEGGCDVTVLARHAPDDRCRRLLRGATVRLGDAADDDALLDVLEGATHVIDALGTPRRTSDRSSLAPHDEEIPVLRRILRALRHRPGVGFTFLSSGGAVYGDVARLPIREDVECHPVSPYAATKLAAERRVLVASREFGLDARILRIANAYGGRQRHDTGQGVVATMLHAARTGSPVRIFGDGSAVRDYVDARDAADAVVALSHVEGRGRIVNVGTGSGHQVVEVRRVVERVTGTSLDVRFEPARPSDVGAVVLDVSRLRRLVPWDPRSLADGVEDAWLEDIGWSLRRDAVHAASR